MSQRTNTSRRVAAAAVALGLGFAGATPALAGNDLLGGLLGGGLLGGLLGGDQGLITGHGGLAGADGGIVADDGDQLTGDNGLVPGLLGGVGVVMGSEDAMTVGEPHLQDVRIGGGLLNGLLGLETLTGGLTGQF